MNIFFLDECPNSRLARKFMNGILSKCLKSQIPELMADFGQKWESVVSHPGSKTVRIVAIYGNKQLTIVCCGRYYTLQTQSHFLCSTVCTQWQQWVWRISMGYSRVCPAEEIYWIGGNLKAALSGGTQRGGADCLYFLRTSLIVVSCLSCSNQTFTLCVLSSQTILTDFLMFLPLTEAVGVFSLSVF